MNKGLKTLTILLAVLAVALFGLQGLTPASAQTGSLPYDPAQVLGKPKGQDTFDDARNWTTFDSECFKSEIADGKYVMTAKGTQGYSCWEVTWPLIDNFYVEVVVQTPATCDKNDRYGLLFRAPDNDRGYLFGLTCDGRYSMNVFDGLTTTELVRASTSPAIITGAGSLNRIGVIAYESEYQLYVNGAFLTRVYDSNFIEPGKIGFFVRAATDQPFTVNFDDLKVWLLDDNYYPPQVLPPTYPPVTLPPDPNAPTVTANVNVNIRSGPGTNFPVYGVAPQGASGVVVGVSADRGWWVVSVPTTISGTGTAWVSASYTTLSNPKGVTIPVIQPPLLPPQVVVPPPAYGAPYVVFRESAVLRSGPGAEYPVYGVTSTGASVEVAGKSQDGKWWAIKLPLNYAPDGLGWVYGNYVTPVNTGGVKVIQAPPVPPNVTPDAPGSGAPAGITIEPVNIRSGPGNAYPSYGKVSIGTTMALIGKSPDSQFWVVKLPTDIARDGKGWLPARYVKASNAGSVPVVQPPPPPQ